MGIGSGSSIRDSTLIEDSRAILRMNVEYYTGVVLWLLLEMLTVAHLPASPMQDPENSGITCFARGCAALDLREVAHVLVETAGPDLGLNAASAT